MRLAARPKEINLLQAAAAMGQSRLMHAYEQEFEAVHTETAQILLTYEDIRSRTRYLNIRNTIFTLWDFGVVPIVNENDTVSFAEISGSRTTTSSPRTWPICSMRTFSSCSPTRTGSTTEIPRPHKDARVLRTVEKVTDDVLAGAEGKGSAFSIGRHGVEDHAPRTWPPAAESGW